jgi:transglutaminase-like putative cysteine protease
MNSRVYALAGALALLGVGVAAYKVFALDYPVVPAVDPDRWNVELELVFRGRGEPARVTFFAPRETARQRVLDERIESGGLQVYFRPRARNREGRFVGTLRGRHVVAYQFTVAIRRGESAALPPPPADADLLAASATLPADDPRIRNFAAQFGTQARAAFDFVVKNIDLDEEGAGDAVRALAEGRGSSLGRARLLVALARAARAPARVVGGLTLGEGRRELVYWAEVLEDGRFLPADPAHAQFGALSPSHLAIFEGDGPLAEGDRVDNLEVRLHAASAGEAYDRDQRRRVRRSEAPLDRLSLYRLPLQQQLIFRILLMVPLGALLVALFRNLLGVPTFGTFAPVLIALAFRETTLLWGLVLFALIVAVGLAARSLLDRLQLLLVPRLAVVLTVVISLMAFIALAAAAFDLPLAFSVALFPMVILTVTIERFSIILAEEGARHALRAAAGTALVASAGYAAMSFAPLQRMVFTFPELLLAVAALLLVLGRYTGYRLSELWRFRDLA